MTRAAERSLIGRLVLGRYRILSELARGGMGAVYLARVEGAAGFRKPVVVKRVLPEHLDEDHVARFAREARILSRLRHPNVVSVLDYAEEDSIPLLVLEYVHGYSLAQWLRFRRKTSRPLSVDSALFVVLEILGALEYAHGAGDASGPFGVAHRDVKPANVLLDCTGHVKLVDFGIAFATKERTASAEITDEQVRGTYPYCAPELFEGERASPATDVYAAAVTLYEILAGHNPFAGENMAHIVGQVLQLNPPPLATLRPEIPRALSAAVVRALAKEPAHRFPSAAHLAAALEPHVEARRQVSASFSTEVVTDFSDPQFPALARCRSLEEIERTLERDFEGTMPGAREALASFDEPETETLPADWRGPEREHHARSAAPPLRPTGDRLPGRQTVSAPDTEPEPAPYPEADGWRATPVRDSPRQSRNLMLVALVVAVIAGAVATGVTLAFRPAESAEQSIVVVEGQPTDAAVSGAGNPTPDPGAGDATIAEHGTAPPTAATAPRTRIERLRAAVATRMPSIKRCVNENPADAARADRITLRVKVGEDLSAKDLAISPQSIDASRLGACIRTALSEIRFRNGDESAEFSVPIRIRAAGDR